MSVLYGEDYGKLPSVRLSVAEAEALAVRAWKAAGLTAEDADIAADHVLDASLRGFVPFGLARILAFSEFGAEGPRGSITVTRDSGSMASLDGGGRIGYVVARKATELAIAKAQSNGVGVVAAYNTFGTGLLAYYCEMATREGLVAMVVTGGRGTGPGRSGGVVPFGAITPMLGTNPIAFGFPIEPDPVIWDIGTASVMHGDLLHRAELGEPLPEGAGIDSEGQPTSDAAQVLANGGVNVWGGHRGSGLAIVVQLLGILCGGAHATEGVGFLIAALDPGGITPLEEFQAQAALFAENIRTAKPVPGSTRPRMPYDRSVAVRKASREAGIEIPTSLLKNLEELVSRGPVAGAR